MSPGPGRAWQSVVIPSASTASARPIERLIGSPLWPAKRSGGERPRSGMEEPYRWRLQGWSGAGMVPCFIHLNGGSAPAGETLMSLIRSLFTVKPIEASLVGNDSMSRTLGLKDLIVLGVGAVIG